MLHAIPVLDIRHQQVVRAVGGRRNEYLPLVSPLVESCDPLLVAAKVLEFTKSNTLYVADLDAILTGESSSWPVRLAESFPHVRILIDVGVRTERDVPDHQHDNIWPVLGTETLEGPRVLERLRERCGRFVVSLDLLRGELLGNWRAFGIPHSHAVNEFALEILRYQPPAMIVLDLGSVGESQGISPVVAQAIRTVKQHASQVEVISGGGVRDWHDVQQFHELGADGVLVSTAIHAGSLTFPPPRVS